MLLQAVLALTLPFWGHHAPPHQSLAGPDFEATLHEVGRRCPSVEPSLRSAAPVGLLRIEDDFRGQLSGPARARLDERLPRTSDGRIARCPDRRDASCPASAYLTAFRETRLDGAFVLYLCGHARRLR